MLKVPHRLPPTSRSACVGMLLGIITLAYVISTASTIMGTANKYEVRRARGRSSSTNTTQHNATGHDRLPAPLPTYYLGTRTCSTHAPENLPFPAHAYGTVYKPRLPGTLVTRFAIT